MVNVKSVRCQHANCAVRPYFNHEGHTKGIYCKQHRKEGMVDVMRKQCHRINCKTRPNFNYPGSTFDPPTSAFRVRQAACTVQWRVLP